MSEKQPWYVEERALALASLCLTDRKDVVVQPTVHGEAGIDLLAEVLKDGAKTGRFFGVQVAGQIDLPALEAINHDLQLGPRKPHSEFTIPLCAFLFDVRSNQGYYRWSVEPILGSGNPKLHLHANKAWARLDERAINAIVDQVAAWYDALAVRLRA
jgi:hypothetical protein